MTRNWFLRYQRAHEVASGRTVRERRQTRSSGSKYIEYKVRPALIGYKVVRA